MSILSTDPEEARWERAGWGVICVTLVLWLCGLAFAAGLAWGERDLVYWAWIVYGVWPVAVMPAWSFVRRMFGPPLPVGDPSLPGLSRGF